MINRVNKSALVNQEVIFDYQDQDVRKQLQSNLSYNWIDIVCTDSENDPVIPVSGLFEVYVKTNDKTGFEKVDKVINAVKCGGEVMEDGQQEGAFHGSFVLQLKIVPVNVVGCTDYTVYVRQSDFGKTPTIPTKSYDQVLASGNVQGSFGAFIFGRNLDLNGGQEEHLNDFSPNYIFLENPTQLYVSSSDNIDTSVVMLVTVLDENYNQVQITKTINGQAKEPLTDFDIIRVISFINIGTVTHQGDIYIYSDTTVTGGIPDDQSKILAKSDIFKQQSNIASYTVPSKKYALLMSVLVTSNRSPNQGTIDIYLNVKLENGVQRKIGMLGMQTVGSSSFSYDFPVPIRFEEKTDIYLTAISSVNNYDVAGGFQIQVEDA